MRKAQNNGTSISPRTEAAPSPPPYSQYGYVAEARIFSGNVIRRVRKATSSDENCHYATRYCEVWIDVFETEDEAHAYLAQYEDNNIC